MDTAVQEPRSPGHPEDDAGRRRQVALWVLAFLAFATVAWGLWWFTHPKVFHEVYTESWSQKYDGGGMAPLHIGMAYAHKPYWSSSVRLTDADPLTVENTADAKITVTVCQERAGADIGSVTGDLRDYCTSILNLTAEPLLSLAPEDNERVILTITPRQPGRVRVVGMDLTYRHGWQYGTQAVGEHMVARFTEEDGSN